MSDSSVAVGLLRVRLRIPMCHSLKEKRSALKPCLQRLRTRFEVAAAEVGDHDVWGSAEIAVATVSGSRAHARQVIDRALDDLDGSKDVEVVSETREIL